MADRLLFLADLFGWLYSTYDRCDLDDKLIRCDIRIDDQGRCLTECFSCWRARFLVYFPSLVPRKSASGWRMLTVWRSSKSPRSLRKKVTFCRRRVGVESTLGSWCNDEGEANETPFISRPLLKFVHSSHRIGFSHVACLVYTLVKPSCPSENWRCARWASKQNFQKKVAKPKFSWVRNCPLSSSLSFQKWLTFVNRRGIDPYFVLKEKNRTKSCTLSPSHIEP